MFYGTPSRQIVDMFDKNVLNNNEALVPGMDPLGVQAGPNYKLPKKAGFSYLGDRLLPYGLQKAVNATDTSSIKVSLLGLSMDTNTGKYRLVRTMHGVLPMGTTRPGELMFRRKPVRVDPNKAIIRGQEYMSSVIKTSVETHDAVYSTVPGPGNSQYAIDTAIKFDEYGAITSLNYLLGLFDNNGILTADNYAAKIMRDFRREITSFDQLPSNWDLIRTFITNFTPEGLFVIEPILGGVQSPFHPYDMGIVTHGQPFHAANLVFHKTTGRYPPIGETFGLAIPKSLFIDIDQYCQTETNNVEESTNFEDNDRTFWHYNLFLVVYRCSDYNIAFRVVKTTHTVPYVHLAFKQIYSAAFQKYIQFRKAKSSYLEQMDEESVEGDDWGIYYRPLFTAVYRLGYVPKARKGEPTIIYTEDDYMQFKTFMLTLGNEWETN